ncbi:MAG: VWA domain-containing protein [Tepidisphaeraceae bacterium]
MTVPGQARVGQTVRAVVEIDSAVIGAARVQLAAGNAPVTSTTFVAKAGINSVTVDLPLQAPGLTPIKAAVFPDEKPPIASAGEVFAAVNVLPPADVLWVQSPSDPAAVKSFQTLLGDGIRLVPTAPEAVAERAAGADAVILADTPADQLPQPAYDALLSAVRNGTGLMLTGAARSFGPGGYEESPLAAALPVKMPQQVESIDPSVTLVLIVDTSGSMMGERMDLAKEVARLAMTHLKPHDKVGIVEFYGGKRWAAPIQSAANVAVIQRALDRLTPGGGTTLYPAVEEAAFALRNVRTRAKHLLILSDGAVEEAKFAALIRQMAEDGMMVSAVQVGPPDNSGLANVMPDIARWGNGRYYTVPDAYALPDISFKQPQISMMSPVERTPVDIVAGNDELARNAFTDGSATISGYVRTQAKPTADVLLKTAGGDPLLTRWRFGAGYVAALPTQIGSTMTSGLNGGVSNVVRGIMRQLSDGRGQSLALATTVRDAGIEVDITAQAEAVSESMQPLTLRLKDATGRVVRQLIAEPVSAGRWNVLLPNVTAGAYAVAAELDGDSKFTGQTAVAVSRPESAVGREPDAAKLAAISSFSDLAAERAAALPDATIKWIDLTPWLISAGVLLLAAHVGVRRWPLAKN